jgi:hypothetical protein
VSRPTIVGTSEAGDTPTGLVPTDGGGRSGFLSDVIVELGFASRDTVEQAVRAARSPGSTVARVLVEMGAITEEQLARATAERYGIDYVDLGGFDVDPAAANLIKPSLARRYRAVPIAWVGDELLVAMADPADALGLNDISVMTKLEVRPAVAARPALEALLEALPLESGEWSAPAGEVGGDPEGRAEAAVLPAPGPVEVAADGGDDGDDGDDATTRLRQERDELRAELLRLTAEAEERDELRAELARVTAAAEERDDLRAELARVTAEAEERDELRAELARVTAEAEVRGKELELIRAQLASEETRAAAAEREVEGARRLAETAEREAEDARRHAETAEREAEDARRLGEELAAADERAEQARQALCEMRDEAERERERAAMTERELREQLGEEERRRSELESRLSEVEDAAFAAERSFEELRMAQQRMRGALRALAEPDPGGQTT